MSVFVYMILTKSSDYFFKNLVIVAVEVWCDYCDASHYTNWAVPSSRNNNNNNNEDAAADDDDNNFSLYFTDRLQHSNDF